MSIHIACLEYVHHIVRVFDHECGQIFNIHTSVFITQFKIGLAGFLGKKILDLFIVDLQVWYSDQELPLRVSVNLSKDAFKRSRHDSLLCWVLWHTSNGMCFSCTCLPISEDGSIVTSDYVLTNWVGCLCKDVFLLSTMVMNESSTYYELNSTYFQSYTESKVKTFGTSSFAFCTKTSPVYLNILTALKSDILVKVNSEF